MTTGNVVSLAEACRRKKARRGQLEPALRLSINEKGELDIKETGPNGQLVREWWSNAADTKVIVSALAASIRKLEIEAYYASRPPPPPKPEPKWRTCRINVYGCESTNGCRRRRGHAGPHKDRRGREWS